MGGTLRMWRLGPCGGPSHIVVHQKNMRLPGTKDGDVAFQRPPLVTYVCHSSRHIEPTASMQRIPGWGTRVENTGLGSSCPIQALTTGDASKGDQASKLDPTSWLRHGG